MGYVQSKKGLSAVSPEDFRPESDTIPGSLVGKSIEIRSAHQRPD